MDKNVDKVISFFLAFEIFFSAAGLRRNLKTGVCFVELELIC